MIHLEKFFGLSKTYSDTLDCWYTHLHLTHLEKFPTVFDEEKPDEVVFLPDTLNDVDQIEEKLKELVATENREQYGKEFLKEFEQNHLSITDADQLRRYLEKVYYKLFWLRHCILSLWEQIGDINGKKWKWSTLQEENGRLHSHYWGYLDWALKEVVKVADEQGVYLNPAPEYNIILEYIRPTNLPHLTPSTSQPMTELLLNFTGEKADFDELIYALHASKRITDPATGKPVTQQKLGEAFAQLFGLAFSKANLANIKTQNNFKRITDGKTFPQELASLLRAYYQAENVSA